MTARNLILVGAAIAFLLSMLLPVFGFLTTNRFKVTLTVASTSTSSTVFPGNLSESGLLVIAAITSAYTVLRKRSTAHD